MELYEIKSFGKGYDDSINEEMADASSTQNCLNVTYNDEYGAVSKDVGIRNMGDDSVKYPLSCTVQRVYEGLVDVAGGSGVLKDRKLIIAGGIPYSYCPADLIIPLVSTAVFSSISTDIPDITNFDNKFYIAGGYDYDVREWDGLVASVSSMFALGCSVSTSLDVSNSLSVASYVSTQYMFRAKTIEVFKGRLFLGNTAESSDQGATWSITENRVRWSDQRQPDVWQYTDLNYTDASYVDAEDKSGDEVLRLYTYGDNLLIFKKNSLQRLVFTGGTFVFERSTIDNRTIGNAPWTIEETPQGVVWLNEEGLQVTDGQTVQPLEASKSVTNLLRRLNIGALPYACATSNDPRQEYILAVPIDGSAYNNYLIIWNWKYNTWKIRDISATSLGMWTSGGSGTWEDIEDYSGYEISALKWNNYLLYPSSHYMVLGDSDGYIKRRSIAYNNGTLGGSTALATYGVATYGYSYYGGLASGALRYLDYDAYHETPWLDFDLPGLNKELLRIRPLWKGSDGASVTVSYKSDLDPSWTSTTIDTFDDDGMPEQDFMFARKTGKRFKFRFENNNANEWFTLYRLMIYYNKRDWR